MDIKEIGVTSVVVIGGAVYGISEYGFSDVLSEDIRHVSEVPVAEREVYMDSVVEQFTEFYSGAIYGTDTFSFSTPLKYRNNPFEASFTQIGQSEQVVSPAQVKELKAYHADKWMCEEEDALIFTDKGWIYKTLLKNKDGQLMVSVVCKPPQSLRPAYS